MNMKWKVEIKLNLHECTRKQAGASKGNQKQMKGAKQAEAGSQKSAVRTNTESIAKCYIQITFIMNWKTLFTTLNLFAVGWARNNYAYKTISRPYIIWLSN